MAGQTSSSKSSTRPASGSLRIAESLQTMARSPTGVGCNESSRSTFPGSSENSNGKTPGLPSTHQRLLYNINDTEVEVLISYPPLKPEQRKQTKPTSAAVNQDTRATKESHASNTACSKTIYRRKPRGSKKVKHGDVPSLIEILSGNRRFIEPPNRHGPTLPVSAECGILAKWLYQEQDSLVLKLIDEEGFFPSEKSMATFQSKHAHIFPSRELLRLRVGAVREKVMSQSNVTFYTPNFNPADVTCVNN